MKKVRERALLELGTWLSDIMTEELRPLHNNIIDEKLGLSNLEQVFAYNHRINVVPGIVAKREKQFRKMTPEEVVQKVLAFRDR